MSQIGLFQVVNEQASNRPDAPFLSGLDGRAAMTFSDLLDQTETMGRALRSANVRPESTVVIVTPNGPAAASLFLSVSCFAASAPLNPSYSKEQFDFYVRDLQPSAIVIPSDLDSPIRDVGQDLGVPLIEISDGFRAGMFDIRGGLSTDSKPEPASRDQTALLLHTSGTTARPKLVPIPHSNLIQSAAGIAARLSLDPSDRALNIMPLFHIHGLVGVLLSSLSAGAQVVCTPGLEPSGFRSWVRDHRPTWYSGVPTMHGAILRSVSDETPLQTSLRFIRSSSASLPVSTLEALERVFGVPVVEAYGMTEAAHQMATNPLPPGIRKPGSVGLPAGPEISIREDGGALCSTDVTGEVWIRGETVIDGYSGGRSEESFVDGWFRTGDLGYLDEDGYLFLVGRIKEMINRGGEKVAPASVEAALLEHPDVAEVAVFAVPHRTLGEDVAAAVVPKEGRRSLSPGSLREYALGKMSDASVPGQFLVVERIPKGPTGKVQRSNLHTQLADEFEVADKPPQGKVAELLAQIWSESLEGVEPGANSNFFALGGDSLSGARVAARVRYVFEIDFDIRALFADPVLQRMADRIEQELIAKIQK